ncbi:MAG: hypothetical protein Q8941_21485, partial [Bacteroidota bacterium]|nr:hypothetical protein [Bacteroidota bacterium]
NTYTQIIQPILENLRLFPPNHLSHQAISYCLLADSAYLHITHAENLIKDIVAENALVYRKAHENGSRLVKNW